LHTHELVPTHVAFVLHSAGVAPHAACVLHTSPLPVYPLLHVQVNPLTVSVHVALLWQSAVASAHSLTLTVACAVDVPCEFVQRSWNVRACASVTDVAAPDTTVPTPCSIVHTGGGDGGDEYVHVHVTEVAAFVVTSAGDAVNDVMNGATGGTPITTWRAAEPTLFVQVSVNVVTVLIVTIVIWPRVTAPTPLSIVHAGSGSVGSSWYVHDHITAVATPAVTCDGVATNDVITGICSGASVTCASLRGASCVPFPPPLHAAASAKTSTRARITAPAAG
jgi:hypothetical protein